MNAFQLLKNDHQIVSGLFDQIESTSGRAKTQLFTRLKSELDVHALIEEKIFYPALENKKESREITLEAYEEHKVVKDLLAELGNGSAADEEWDAKLKVLRENVDHHVEEEEGELFDKAGDVLSNEDIERLGGEMEAEKARQMGVAAPATRGAAKREAAKSGGSRKQAESPGVLSRLASFVGLSSSNEGTTSSGKKKGSKASKPGAARKSSTKSAAKKSGSKKSSKAAKKSTKGGGTRTAASKGAAKKSTKRSGGSKKKTGGSKKR